VQATVTPFPDVPENHGRSRHQPAGRRRLHQGYPNGKFEGARPMTRYEVAYLVSEAVSSLKDAIATGGHASQPDIDALKKLLATFGTEVADLQTASRASSRRRRPLGSGQRAPSSDRCDSGAGQRDSRDGRTRTASASKISSAPGRLASSRKSGARCR